MIEINKDSKSETWILTKTDSEGFHHQIHVTEEELNEIAEVAMDVLYEKAKSNFQKYRDLIPGFDV